MSVAQSYKVNAAAKQHERLKGAYRRFTRLLGHIDVKQVSECWYMAKVSGLVAFGCDPEIARKKCEAGLREQLLSELRVVGERTRERVAA